ncbi:MAG: hypothetical protein K2X99_11095 [Gemmatimonadaceae bacterium]|nr:hypothetical protein [Gemmatimonadaceae bacterium]
MLSALSTALLGFLLGLRHATDADHVVAVTAIVARERSLARAARIGVWWGLGHTLTVLVLGGAIIGFRLTMPPRLGLALEFGVALMLIVIGFSTLRPSAAAAPTDAPDRRPFLVGTMHGLAGSAAVAVLVLATIQDPWWAIVYLLVFGVGTIAGMLLVTVLIAAPSLWLGARVERMQLGLRLVAGALSVVFGLLLARELTQAGLFGGPMEWTPR